MRRMSKTTGVGILLCSVPALKAAGFARQADFNNDGFADLAIAVPFESVAGAAAAGQVHILYGSAEGLTSTNSQVWSLDSAGIEGTPRDDDNFGSSMAAGDFDNDGFSDLAIGIPNRSVDGLERAGAVLILYGSADGLDKARSTLWDRGDSGVSEDPKRDALFGAALAAGDFDNDGRDDLAVGVTGAKVGGLAAAGQVHILYGAANGIAAAGDQVFDQNTGSIFDTAEEGDEFGRTLAAGDFNGDFSDDLAIGVPLENGGGLADGGVVHALFGSSNGLKDDDNRILRQGIAGLSGEFEAGDQFGVSLAVGDYDNDNKFDLVVGLFQDSGGKRSSGAVHVIYGATNGLTALDNKVFSQNTNGIPDSAEKDDFFGWSVVTGDFGGDFSDDVAIGIPFEDLGAQVDCGAVQALYGSDDGLRDNNNQFWHQDKPDVPSQPKDDELFGWSGTAGDYDGDNLDDLAIGVPGEVVGGDPSAGVVIVLYGDGTVGLMGEGSQLWDQDSPGISGQPNEGDQFGRVLR